MGHVLRKKQKNKRFCIYEINHNGNEDESEGYIT